MSRYYIQRVYFIAEPDEEGRVPMLASAVGDRMYTELDKAKETASALNRLLGVHERYKVFLATIEIPRDQLA